MGGNTSTSQTESAIKQTPSWLTPYYQGGAGQATAAQSNLPSLSSIYGQFPTLGTAPLTAGQNSIIGQFNSNIGPNTATTGGLNALAGTLNTSDPNLGKAESSLGSFLGSPGTPSTATEAALKEFKDLQAPEIMQQAVLNGQGNSGAVLQALAQGQEAALVPFLQQDQANSLNAAGTLGNLSLSNTGQRQAGAEALTSLGQNQEQITQNQLQNALAANTLPQQNAQQQLQSLFNTATNKLGYAQGIQTGPLNSFTSLIGELQNLAGSSNEPKF